MNEKFIQKANRFLNEVELLNELLNEVIDIKITRSQMMDVVFLRAFITYPDKTTETIETRSEIFFDKLKEKIRFNK